MSDSIQFTLQKIIKQYKQVSVPLTDDLWKKNEKGTLSPDVEKLEAIAIELGKKESTGWQDESVEIILNPIQKPK